MIFGRKFNYKLGYDKAITSTLFFPITLHKQYPFKLPQGQSIKDKGKKNSKFSKNCKLYLQALDINQQFQQKYSPNIEDLICVRINKEYLIK